MRGKGEELVSLEVQYFNFCLTSMACQVDFYIPSLLKKIELPCNIVSYYKKNIKADKFFSNQPVYLISGFKTNGHNLILPEVQSELEKKYKKELSNKILIWGDEYLHSMLIYNYICTEIKLYEEDCKIYKLEKMDFDANKNILVECDDIRYIQKLEEIHYHECSRASIYGVKQYSRVAVKKNYISGFEHFPNYSTCCIYSPFSRKEQIDELMNNTKDMDNNDITDFIKNKLPEYITPYMIEIVKKDNINVGITENEIKEEYISMLSEFVKIKRAQQSSGKNNNLSAKQ